MLSREKVLTALEHRRRDFQAYVAGRQEQRLALNDRLKRFYELDRHAIVAALEAMGDAWPGAYPTTELDGCERLCLPFTLRWSNHQEARAWAMARLENRTTLAVDGSQITPNQEYSVPVGAIQVGWFVNEHCRNGQYFKDLEFEVLTPDELAGERDNPGEGFATETINQVRFARECRKLSELMAAYADLPEGQKPLCFFDGSFIISFAGRIRHERARLYTKAVADLLADSERHRVPLVAFVDSSQSGDLATLIDRVTGARQATTLPDAELLWPELGTHWGNRTPLFICARPDALSVNGEADFYRQVVFTYVTLANGRPPARIEMPIWLLASGRADEILDLVRAECIVGTGYPYVIETADALAVISQPDRQRFFALFQQFAAGEGLTLTQTRKARSKRQRR